MSQEITRKYPRCIATISAGFEKGDFLVREEKGQRVYFDFFEEAFNYIAAKGYSRMPKGEEGEWMDLMVSYNVMVFFGCDDVILFESPFSLNVVIDVNIVWIYCIEAES